MCSLWAGKGVPTTVCHSLGETQSFGRKRVDALILPYIYILTTQSTQSSPKSSFAFSSEQESATIFPQCAEKKSLSESRTDWKSMGRVFTLLELLIGRLLSTRTVVAGHPNGEFFPGWRRGCWRSILLVVVLTDVFCVLWCCCRFWCRGSRCCFGECTTWTLSRRVGPQQWALGHGRVTRAQSLRNR